MSDSFWLIEFTLSFLCAEGPSLLGLSHISNISMNVNETALTTAGISHIETPDPVDSFDITVCRVDDLLDGCKVSFTQISHILDIVCMLHMLHLCEFKCWIWNKATLFSTPISSWSCTCVAFPERNWRNWGGWWTLLEVCALTSPARSSRT